MGWCSVSVVPELSWRLYECLKRDILEEEKFLVIVLSCLVEIYNLYKLNTLELCCSDFGTGVGYGYVSDTGIAQFL